jgi:uncharacterized membrane protein
MNNDLIAMIFGSEQDALTVKSSLGLMRYSQLIGAVHVVPVTRDRKGNVIVHLKDQQPPEPVSPYFQIPELLAMAMFGKTSEQDIQKLIDMGLDGMFVKQVTSSLVPDSSLILNYIPRDSLVDPEQILNSLSGFRGTVLYTTISDELQEALLEL